MIIIKPPICTVFPCLTLSWHALIIFRIFIIETKLDFVSLIDKNLQRRRKFVAERDFLILNSYTGQVKCLSHSRDQTFVTSLVENAIDLLSPLICSETALKAHTFLVS